MTASARTDDIAFLKARVALLADFNDERLRELAAGSRIETYDAGDIIVYAGDELHFLAIILDGKIAASVPNADGTNQLLGELDPGETFGEMALMSGDPGVADFAAADRSRVMLVPLTLFQSHIMAEPRALQHISRTIGARLQKIMSDPRKAAAVSRKEDVAGLLELKSERAERILVLNCGSSSLKYSFFDTEKPDKTAHGHIEKIGADGYGGAFAAMLRDLKDSSSVSVVGHRVVHGGEKFTSAVLIDDEVLREIETLSPLAPLHNPVNVAGIREARRVFPAVPHVAVFDTAFHATLPSQAYLYGLPNEFYVKKGVRRYGFHGSSHSYVALAAAQFLKRRPRELKIISCHLGSGASVCAIDHGRSVDTSMGFTPGEGLIMGTRCGDLDSGVLTFLQRDGGMTAAQLDELLNKKSGLLGLSGISNDMREVEKAADAGDAHALTALKTFCYRVRKYIGAYVAAMGGLDVLIFTAGIGQGSAGVRATALQGPGVHGHSSRRGAQSRSVRWERDQAYFDR
jgi:acetate kinase